MNEIAAIVGCDRKRVPGDVHPLAIFLFLRTRVGPRDWWVRACAGCGTPIATPSPAFRFCEAGCGTRRGEGASA